VKKYKLPMLIWIPDVSIVNYVSGDLGNLRVVMKSGICIVRRLGYWEYLIRVLFVVNIVNDHNDI